MRTTDIDTAEDINFDSQINWQQFNRAPTQTARVRPIWRGTSTRILPSIEGTITIELPGRTREEAMAGLDTDGYEFVEWAW